MSTAVLYIYQGVLRHSQKMMHVECSAIYMYIYQGVLRHSEKMMHVDCSGIHLPGSAEA